MPGIHFYYDADRELGSREPLLLQSVKSLLHEDWHRQKTLMSTDSIFLGYTYHPNYPIEKFENTDFLICMEGKFYGESASRVDSKLAELTTLLYGNSNSSDTGPESPGYVKARITEWLLDTDGDFVIFILHKSTGQVCILNDSLGRLPLYCSRIGSKLIVSREIRFITDTSNNTCLDRMAIAQYLLLGFMPGGKTLVENVTRLEPATIIWITPADDKPTIRNLYSHDFSSKEHEGKSMDEIASEMTSLFCKACGDRAATCNEGAIPGTVHADVNVLATSGGLDSRSVAAGLARMEVPFYGATFLDHFKTAAPDVVVAREIARTLGFDWKLFPLDQANGSDVLRLLRMKSGMNFLGMSFSMPLFDQIRDTWGGNITYFTGEGGGLLIPDNRPFRKMKNLDDLTSHLIERNCILSLEQTASITGIESDYIFDSIRDYLDACPETDLAMKYVHFIVCERNLKWTAEGEDRNRFFFWTVTPFNSLKFFHFVMNVPDFMKSKHRLYREFLLRLSPRAAALNNSNWNLPIAGKKYLIYMYARELYYRMPARLKSLVRRKMKFSTDLIGPYSQGSGIMMCFRDQMYGCEATSDYLSSEEIEILLPSLNKFAFDHIFTVASLIEDLSSGQSSLVKYLNSDLI